MAEPPATAVAVEHAQAVRSVVVLRPNYRLGNTLLLMPLVRELETRFPQARITLVSGFGGAASLFRGYERVSAQHCFYPKQLRQTLRTLWTLRRQSFDLAIDPIIRSRTARALARYVRAREVVGYRWGSPRHDRVLTHVGDPGITPEHFSQWPVWLLRSAYFGLSADEALAERPVPMDLRLTAEERQHGQRRLASALAASGAHISADARGRPAVALFANATGEKLYPVEWWRQLLACFRGSNVQFVEIIPADGRPRLPEIPGLHTPDLRVLGATLAASSLLVIADSGVMHLAEAAGAPILGLFRTTPPGKYASLRVGSEALWGRDLVPEAAAARMRQLLFSSAHLAAG